ncbi:MAG: phage major capsid protein [Phycisphaerae bacterium]|nr:phage major capsid protein [Phycisphaerae bacterium]
MAKDASDADNAATTVREIGERINRQLDAAVKGMKEFEEKLKHHTELLERLGGEKVEGDATLAEQVAAQKTASEEVRKLVEQYSKQLPGMTALHGAQRDPEYAGLWPNAERAAQFGQFVLAQLHPNGDVRRACAEELAKAGLTLRSAAGRFVKGEDFVKAMGEGAGATGGYLVPDEFVATFIRHVNEYGVLRKYLRQVPMSSARQSWPVRKGGLTVYYPDEGVAITASDVSLGKVTLTAKKWAALSYFSKELDEDAVIPLGELLGFEFALAFAQAEDLNGFMGDGTSTYAGITGVFSSANVATVTMASGKDTFAEVDHDELVALKYAVPDWVRKMPDCGYYMCSGIAGLVERIADTTGRPMYNQPTEGHPLKVAGFPVRETEVLPDTGDDAVSTKFIAFGSLYAWGMLGQRRGMSLERSDQVKWLEEQIAIKAVCRQDIQEAVGEAMAVLKTAAS